MAKAAKTPTTAKAQDTSTGPVEKPRKKLFLILIITIVFLAAGGSAAAFLLTQNAAHAEETAAIEEPAALPPTFVSLDQFVVNLTEPDTTRYLQTGITYEVSNPATAEEMKTFIPIIRSRILMVLSNKNVGRLTSIEGKQELMDELVDLARVTIKGDPKDPTRGVRDVHFSSFVIQ